MPALFDRILVQISGSSERELTLVLIRPATAVRASRLAGLGAGAESLFNNGLDRGGAPTAFDAATKAAIDLPRIAWKILRSVDSAADIVVAEDVAGTNNHGNRETFTNPTPSILKRATGCKRKNRLLK
jgi:hypothetical protein